jgi:NADH-quinone oxidoreductase subunit M
MLSLLLFLPIFSLAIYFLLPHSIKFKGGRYWVVSVLLIQTIVFIATIFSGFSVPAIGFNVLEKADWLHIPLGSAGSLKIDYILGLDGLNVWLVALTLFLLFLATFASWGVEKPQTYFPLLLLLDSALIGSFLALDFFLFFILYELLLLPMFFLIGGWGGEKRTYAAIKFFLFTVVGSLAMLLAIIGLQAAAIDPFATSVKIGLSVSAETVTQSMLNEVWQLLAQGKLAGNELVHTFQYTHLAEPKNYIPGALFALPGIRFWGFIGIFLAFAIKLPLFPFHTWLPDAHVQASTPISVLLAGILLKVGGYGLMRWLIPIFPDVFLEMQFALGVVAIVSMLYGALNALAQKNLKSMIAYSSVAHMGLVLLGIAAFNPQGFNGAIYQLIAHGLISGMLFLLAGILYTRVQNYQITAFQGLWNKQPNYTFFIVFAFFAALGLPGFCGFIAEFLVLAGAFAAPALPLWLTLWALLGILLTAGYFLRTLQTMFLGAFEVENKEWEAKLTDLTPFEKWQLYPLAALITLLGLFPGLLLHYINPTAEGILSDMQKAAQFWLP